MSAELSSISPTPPADAPFLTLTEKAVEKVKYFASQMPESAGKPLRIFVQGGGCSGFQYGFTFDDKRDNDTEFSAGSAGEVQVIVDPQSAMYLKGASVDYLEDFRGAGFSVNNPNATGGCGCGKSFNV
jgi:iron-sulfur cluster assembly accessory protein